jgi:hypothetical protein
LQLSIYFHYKVKSHLKWPGGLKRKHNFIYRPL